MEANAVSRKRPAWFVARADDGVYLLDGSVERLVGGRPADPDRSWGAHGAPARRLARTMLAEHLRDTPSPELAEAFADDVVAYLPRDGWVLAPEDVDAWLRRAGHSAPGAA